MTSPPHEPEIELLGRIASRALWTIRRVLWLAGAVAIGFGVWISGRDAHWTFAAPYSLLSVPAATGVVWISVGLPLLCRVDWLFGRGRWRALLLGVSLWFGASAMPGDRDYGWILRIFASLVACLTLLVWRTLWRLTRTAAPG
jgi:hypothetical protein